MSPQRKPLARQHPHPAEEGQGDGSPQDPHYSRDKFYISGKDSFGHSEKGRDVKIQPWLKDIIGRIVDEIPAYRGQFTNAFRNYCTHGARYDIERIEDPKTREQLLKEFQLHVDMEDQARNLQRYAEMQRYVNSCRAALALYAETKNWMMVTREVEKMKKNLSDGVLWEPCSSEVESLVIEYGARLRSGGKS